MAGRSFATAKDVHVEVFVAGNGVDYPKSGQFVTIHYSADVRPLRCSSSLMLCECIHYREFLLAACRWGALRLVASSPQAVYIPGRRRASNPWA